MILRSCCTIAALLLACVSCAADPPRFRVLDDGKAVAVEGLDKDALAALARADWKADDWASLFALYVQPTGGGDATKRPAVLGAYAVADGALRFTPRYPLAPGVHYRAVFHPDRLPGRKGPADAVEAEVFVPKPKRAEATAVAHVYPSADELPENQLKFYLHFSAPMGRGEAYDHIHLLDADGKPVPRPFLELGEELWDPEYRRLTLFIDPGRIKRGLKPREDLGPVLEKGKRYALVVDADWPDADGEPLKAAFRKEFTAGAADDSPPDPKTWKLAPPGAGGRAPLTVTLPKAMDHALLHRLLWVEDADGKRVPGDIAVSESETRWQFTPKVPWASGDYRLAADSRLEDLAGNSLGRPFEVDVLHPTGEGTKPEVVRTPFAVKPAGGPP